MLLVKSLFISSSVRIRATVWIRYQNEAMSTIKMMAEVARIPAICRKTMLLTGSVVSL